jgi:hypothetical protein
MSITIAQICNAIESTLGAAVTALDSTGRYQSYDELTDGMNVTPTLQVYPESGVTDIGTGNDRTTFGAGVRQSQYIFNADYYARTRSHIGEDMKAIVDGADAIIAKLEAQQHEPAFGLSGIKAFRWTWQRVTFNYGGVDFAGVRFTLYIHAY